MNSLSGPFCDDELQFHDIRDRLLEVSLALGRSQNLSQSQSFARFSSQELTYVVSDIRLPIYAPGETSAIAKMTVNC
jgi:hypothetical protein